MTPRLRRARHRTSLAAQGEPMIWLAGGALMLAVAMIVGLLAAVAVLGFRTFWPTPLWQMTLRDGAVHLAEIARVETVADRNQPAAAPQVRRQIRTMKPDGGETEFLWINDADLQEVSQPVDALLVERYDQGRCYGLAQSLSIGGQLTTDAAALGPALAEQLRRPVAARPADGRLTLGLAGGGTLDVALANIVRAYPANRLSFTAALRVYASRWAEFLSADPRQAGSEGGVYPAIFGTVTMTLLMALGVAPLGVIAALYLREYARKGWLVTAVRIAVNNLAGVPSIVFGIFGLGFFCYLVGASIDDLFFADSPTATFGTGGVLWASLTLALLTLPVVIVASEEALAAVPSSMREGSYACGASKWQTIWRIVLPRALPGIMTGMILAMSRGAGEVAPLMLVGAAKAAPLLPIDGHFPYLHLQRSFEHLGFHIYDLAFQNEDAEASRPMVFTTTLLLIAIVAMLNLLAIWLRSRLRRRFQFGQF